MKEFFDKTFGEFNIRVVIMYVTVCLLFAVAVFKLYSLQIKQGTRYSEEVNVTTLREITVASQRGSIYDRYGRELAVNKYTYTVSLDPSVTGDDINSSLHRLIDLFDKNGEKLLVNLPITTGLPHEFLFGGDADKEKKWKSDMGLDENLTADECYTELKKRFEIDESLDPQTALKLIGLRCLMYEKRYSKYQTIPIAYDISDATLSVLKEQSSSYPCAEVDRRVLRHYPYGQYLSHILGYIGNITDTELKNDEKGIYSINDVVGKDGIEKAFESDLKGENGIQKIEVDILGRKVANIEGGIAPVNGSNVQLTIDAEFQKSTYIQLEDCLRNEQIQRLSGAKDFGYTTMDVFKKMIETDNIHIRNILNSKEGTVQGELKAYILSVEPEALSDTQKARDALYKGYDSGPVSSYQLMMALYEQGQIFDDDNVITRMKEGDISANTALILKLRRSGGDITPQMTGMDPCTGSVTVTDVHTGDVLAAVTYPSYDNNELVNDFNNEYYLKLQSDPTTPMVNRPFTEPRAPGSIFKMITAVAALNEGVVTRNTTIHDEGTFKDAGEPYARCWIGGGLGTHGDVNVTSALEVSCNYYFYSVSYMLGEHSGTSTTGIEKLNKYMRAFGLDSPTGVEIYELYDSMGDYPSNISSPEYKKYITQLRYPDALPREYNWTAGDTIRTAIGQSFNNYTSAIISKYIATLANGGTRYQMHLMKMVSDNDSNAYKVFTPKVEERIEIDNKDLQAIYQGMYNVAFGEHGTLKKQFEGYPIKIAAKSGTAQQSTKRAEHTTCAAFAPYDSPEISIAVFIPFGNGETYPAAETAKRVIQSYMSRPSQPVTRSYNSMRK